MVPNILPGKEWWDAVKKHGFAAVMCTAFFFAGLYYLNLHFRNESASEEARVAAAAKVAEQEAEAKRADVELRQRLLEKMTSVLVDSNEKSTVAVTEMKVAVQGIQAMNRRQMENDRELLSIQREIRDSLRLQSSRPMKVFPSKDADNVKPAPKSGGG